MTGEDGRGQPQAHRLALIAECIGRHRFGDWGTVDAHDRKANDDAVLAGNRILSAYTVDDRKIWIITEADRASTTVLFPEEY